MREANDYRAYEEPEVDVVEEALEFLRGLDRVPFATGLAEPGVNTDIAGEGVRCAFAFLAFVPIVNDQCYIPFSNNEQPLACSLPRGAPSLPGWLRLAQHDQLLCDQLPQPMLLWAHVRKDPLGLFAFLPLFLLEANGLQPCMIEDHNGIPVTRVKTLCDAVNGVYRRRLGLLARVGQLRGRWSGQANCGLNEVCSGHG